MQLLAASLLLLAVATTSAEGWSDRGLTHAAARGSAAVSHAAVQRAGMQARSYLPPLQHDYRT